MQAHAFATITMYSWWQPSEIGCAYRIWNFGALAKGGWKLVVKLLFAKNSTRTPNPKGCLGRFFLSPTPFKRLNIHIMPYL